MGSHTLRSIAAAEGVTKDTIQKRYARAKAKHGADFGEIISGVRTFTDAEKDLINAQSAKPTGVPAPVVEVGTGGDAIPTPAHLESVSLTRFAVGGGGLKASTIEDPRQLLAVVEAGLGAIENAMEQEILTQQQRLNSTQSVKRKLTRRIQAFDQTKTEWRLLTGLAKMQQGEAADSVGELLGIFQGLQQPSPE